MRIITFIFALCTSLAYGFDYQWTFPTDTNPSYSETAHPVALTVETGPFSLGWVNHLPFSTNTGFWDLGSAGTMTASFADDGTHIIVETVEWYDGAIYGSFATVSVSGSTFLTESFNIEEPWPVVGNWVRHVQEYSISSAAWSMTITGSTNGTIIGSVKVNAFRSEAVFGLWVESSSNNGPWNGLSDRPLMLVTNAPGSSFYRINISPYR